MEEVFDKQRKKAFQKTLFGCDLNQSELIVEVAKLKEIQKKNTDSIFLA